MFLVMGSTNEIELHSGTNHLIKHNCTNLSIKKKTFLKNLHVKRRTLDTMGVTTKQLNKGSILPKEISASRTLDQSRSQEMSRIEG